MRPRHALVGVGHLYVVTERFYPSKTGPRDIGCPPRVKPVTAGAPPFGVVRQDERLGRLWDAPRQGKPVEVADHDRATRSQQLRASAAAKGLLNQMPALAGTDNVVALTRQARRFSGARTVLHVHTHRCVHESSLVRHLRGGVNADDAAPAPGEVARNGTRTSAYVDNFLSR
jgi:hypothetical protein